MELPSPDGKLYIDDKLFEGADGKVMREFVTAKLEPGKRYVLDLRVEVLRNGKMVTAAKEVVFQADTEQQIQTASDLVHNLPSCLCSTSGGSYRR